MKRTNVYLSEKQLERLRERVDREGVAVAELVRRAVDAFLAWDDATYTPGPSRPERNGLNVLTRLCICVIIRSMNLLHTTYLPGIYKVIQQ